ncbi:class I SAM-dependent RNA methyltransferase [Brevibacterium pigmentatum]|uniref:class I SAM-dependent RNA methyltransferase n=1 Tax=Brevibacterium pigmentatum TaxID=1496080 RepID=UPI001420C83F|nr:TRAM domain-containing protein [Brevibacterium pigmentatum]
MSDTSVPAQELTLDIEAPAAGGTSIARHDGQVVFVSGALPGEKVRARTEAGPPARFLRAAVTEVVDASAHRVPNRRLDYVSTGPAGFGGMEFAHVDLAHSRSLKAEVLRDQLSRIGHIDSDAEVLPAPGETDGTDWRTRVQLAVDDEGRAGMLAPRSHEVVPVSTPPLAVGALHDLDIAALYVPGVRRLEFAWAGDHGALIVRGQPTAQVLNEIESWLPTSFSLLAEAAEPEQNRGRGRGGRSRGRGRSHAHAPALRVLRGDRTLTETVDGCDFTVGADGFWQVHRDAAALLSSAVVDALPADVDAITDLYCGVGLLGISAARATGAPLFGVEGVATAIAHARDNAADLEAQFLALSVDRARLPDSDVVILDPPRAGAGRKATSAIIESSAHTLVYVSCDPATLARDLAALTGGGFEIESLTGFDLFPLTAHLETVTVLRR